MDVSKRNRTGGWDRDCRRVRGLEHAFAAASLKGDARGMMIGGMEDCEYPRLHAENLETPLRLAERGRAVISYALTSTGTEYTKDGPRHRAALRVYDIEEVPEMEGGEGGEFASWGSPRDFEFAPLPFSPLVRMRRGLAQATELPRYRVAQKVSKIKKWRTKTADRIGDRVSRALGGRGMPAAAAAGPGRLRGPEPAELMRSARPLQGTVRAPVRAPSGGGILGNSATGRGIPRRMGYA